MNTKSIRRNAGRVLAVFAFAGLMLAAAPSASASLVAIEDGAWFDQLGTDSDSSLAMARIVLEPGARLGAHEYAGAAVVTVNSGIMETTIFRGSGTVYRGTDDGIESVGRGETGWLRNGDSIAYEAGSGQTLVNASDAMLVVIVSTTTSDGQPLFSFIPKPHGVSPHLQ